MNGNWNYALRARFMQHTKQIKIKTWFAHLTKGNSAFQAELLTMLKTAEWEKYDRARFLKLYVSNKSSKQNFHVNETIDTVQQVVKSLNNRLKIS